MKSNYFASIVITCLALVSFSTYAANEFAPQIEAHLKEKAMMWINKPVVINAIKAQNVKNANLSSAQIDALDKKWRAGVDGGDTSIIDDVLNNPLSNYLEEIKFANEDIYTEIFVMDDKGLNVGQSDITSDYWQGDEAKWQDTYLKGPGAINISDLEEDESTGAFQAQLSTTIVDPDTGKAIGAITIGIAVDGL